MQLRFEAAVAGVIPIVRVIQESFGVTEIARSSASSTAPPTSSSARWPPSGAGYEEVLARAQELGYAEADPTDDVSGADAAAKMAILARLAFHTPVTLDEVSYEGIDVAGRRHPRRRPSAVRRGPRRAVALAGMMAVVSGTVCILAGVARLGFVTELLSKPIRYGYMNGIALTVLISQLPKLFGFSIESEGPLRDLWAIAEAVLGGKANWTAFVVGAGTLAVILLLKGSKRLPGILIAVVGATAIVGMLDLAVHYNVAVLGPAPTGPAGVRGPLDHLRRYRPGADRRLRHRPGVVRRYQRALAFLCCPNRH